MNLSKAATTIALRQTTVMWPVGSVELFDEAAASGIVAQAT